MLLPSFSTLGHLHIQKAPIMEWHIKHIFNFTETRPWANGYCGFGFYGKRGTQYLLRYTEHWLGCLTARMNSAHRPGSGDGGLSSDGTRGRLRAKMSSMQAAAK